MKKLIVFAACICCAAIFCDFNALGETDPIAPDFSLKGLNNRTIELKDFKGRKPVLLFFWTSWCPFCLKELKALNKDFLDLSKKEVELLVINTGERESKARGVVKRYGLVFDVFLDEDGTVADAYDIYGVPTFILIDRRGNVVFSDNRFPREEIEMLCRQN